MLGGLSQSRVSQLVRTGELVVERDPEGKLKYDRETTERYARARAVKFEPDPQAAEEKRLLQIEARERLARERKKREQEERERRASWFALASRAVEALERIARCGK